MTITIYHYIQLCLNPIRQYSILFYFNHHPRPIIILPQSNYIMGLISFLIECRSMVRKAVNVVVVVVGV